MLRLASAALDGDRFVLPDEVEEYARSPELTGKEVIKCWLVVLNPGRYRLASGEALETLLRQIDKMEVPGDVIHDIASDQHAAVRSRLMPCTISPRNPGWRVNLPKEVRRLAPGGEECRSVFVLVVMGFIEFWFPETLRQAVSGPISEALRDKV